jgi:hypothetical protein
MTTSIKADKLDLATAEKLREAQVDIHGAAVVDVQTDIFAGKRRIWVNVNGICVLRVNAADRLRIIQMHEKSEQTENLYDLAPKVDLSKTPDFTKGKAK